MTQSKKKVIAAGKGEEPTKARAGALMLMLASEPSNRDILRRVSRGPVDWSPHQIARILPSGEEVLFIAFTIEQWLRKAPGGPLQIDDERARVAVGALAEGWSATIPHALASGPLTAAELADRVEEIGAARLGRLLDEMTEVGLLEAMPGGGVETRYAIADFLRAATAPIATGIRFERRYAPGHTPPLEPSDVEAGFGLALPLLRLPPELEGVCRLMVSVVVRGEGVPVGATARVAAGRVASVSTELVEECDAVLEGPSTAWLDAVIEPQASRLLPEGDEELAAALLAGLHDALFGVPVG